MPKHLSDKIHTRLKRRLRIYLMFSLVILGISLFHIIKDGANIFLCFFGFLLGVIIGAIMTKILKISWDKDSEMVISKFNLSSIVLIISYILFEINREYIVSRFISGPSVIAVSFAIFSGIMGGRYFLIKQKVLKILKHQGY
ncbi:MAG: hypothetical protein PHC89_02850 [Candidatus Pacebacteria bacterium]|nr:hypothetical protein [Candidatus Paceibacterota bacterium]